MPGAASSNGGSSSGSAFQPVRFFFLFLFLSFFCSSTSARLLRADAVYSNHRFFFGSADLGFGPLTVDAVYLKKNLDSPLDQLIWDLGSLQWMLFTQTLDSPLDQLIWNLGPLQWMLFI